MKEIGLGLIGLGFIGNVHLQHALKLRNARLVGVADVSNRALIKARESGAKRTYKDYSKLLRDPDVDAVIIALPTHLHFQSATQAAEAGKDIFIEKPLARNVAEGKELVSLARRHSVRLMVGYPLEFNETFRGLKDRIRNGDFGDIEVALATNISAGPFTSRADIHTPIPVPEWWFNKELTGGGALMDLGCHMINLLRWYFGEIIDIRSHLEHKFNLELEDSAICLAKFSSGTRALVNVGWFSQAYRLQVGLSGTIGHFTTQEEHWNPLSNVVYTMTRGASRFLLPYFTEVQYFTDCLIQDRYPSPSGEEGLRDLEAIAQAYKNEIRLE